MPRSAHRRTGTAPETVAGNKNTDVVGRTARHTEAPNALAAAPQHAVWDWNIETGEAFFSTQLTNLIGESGEDFRTTLDGYRRRIHPEDRPRAIAAFEEHLAGKTRIFDVTYRLRDMNGEYRMIESRGVCIRNRRGDPVRYIGVIADLTSYREAEASQRDDQRRLKLMLDALPPLIAYIDKEERYQFVNAAYETFYARPADQVVGRKVRDVTGEARFQTIGPLIKRALTGERITSQHENPHPLDPNDIRSFEAQLVPNIDEEGEVHGTYVIINDVTEKRKTEQQLVQSSKMATLGQMAAGMAHELAQPLNVIRMAADNATIMSEEDGPDLGFIVGQLNKISEQTIRMARIIDHMRVFSRNDKSDHVAFDPTGSILASIEMVKNIFRPDNIRIDLSLGHRARSVRGVPTQLEQVLVGILTNARDAILLRGASASRSAALDDYVRIDTSFDEASATVAIRLSDSGGGMPEEVLNRVFDPFFTTKEPGQGTGLGLSIAFRIIEQFGGRLSAANGPGGAEFRIDLPVADEQDAAQGIRRPTTAHAAAGE